MELNFVHGTGILVAVVGLFLVIVGALIYTTEVRRFDWERGPYMVQPYMDEGTHLMSYGFVLMPLGVALFIIGSIYERRRKRRKGRGLRHSPDIP